MSTTDALEVTMFRTMARIKACDERIRQGITSGELQCAYYSPRGQEAIAAAIGASLRPDDYLVTTYRGIHDQIAKGVGMLSIVAEMLGRAAGASGGKGGGMHIADPDVGLMLTTGIVGGGLPIANGLALAATLQGDGRVTAVCFGDGASNIGAFHESLNLAAVWALPIVFVCQNNRYGEMTPFGETQRTRHVSDRAASYGMPGITVDGNDPVVAYDALADAVDRARRGEGPTLVECETFRFNGHAFGDAMEYITTDEMEAARAEDPYPRVRDLLVERGLLSAGEAEAIEKAAADEADAAVKGAVAAPPPTPDAYATDVYGSGVRPGTAYSITPGGAR